MPLRVTHLWAFFGALSERFITEEILGLQRCGVQPSIVSLRPAPSATSTKDETLREHVRYLMPGPNPVANALRAAPAVALRPWVWTRRHEISRKAGWERTAEWIRAACLRGRLAGALSATKPDVLHAQHGHVGWLALPVARRLGIPMMVSLRGHDVALLRCLAGAKLGRMFGIASRFLARCEDMAAELRGMGFPEDRVFVHPSGVPVKEIPFRERTRPTADQPLVLLSVGRLVPKKGMTDTISALAASRAASHRVVLRIVGAGPEEMALKDLAAMRGVASRVQFLGALPHERVLAEMAAAQVFILASRATADGDREGVPNAIKEAAASGLPVVSTTHGGIPEVVEDGVSGLLAPEGSVEGLTSCLDRVLRQPRQWPAMGRRGREIVEQRYDIDRLSPLLVEHYRALLSERVE